ncbi:bifunctional 3,4-dihydroxy-2-butanone-4-phosphate synthase/GTP cyclohydrolase II [Mycobacterium vulneris]|uniref:Riboflavin biosynthesis protein RibBA n=1 Tax=Mycolicibacterium vulneris TaxID=547163 RepID=A0A1X2KQU3_9MYCO|nr:bifunctional 3,4-dihydroxy-2-butanone-4-phosphate synthase/GTP cyclohydrolase II [Mycolicibacterium vulneris]OSC23653.1 bifunctional 3,4-dihydroxy-2-butanone-4-phosphate synthase/GTP cyclohydrolase II [Mycolicibacterium vulneris]
MYSDITDAIAAVAAGAAVVVLDDDDRENEADLIMAAQFATVDKVAFFLAHTSGFLCTSISAARAEDLNLSPMVQENTDKMATAFTVSVDVLADTTTGISAHDRAATARALADSDATAAHFTRPGHMMPLVSRPGGVLKRAGHTEAGTDLCELAGVQPAALLCELVSPDRTEMLRGADAVTFAHQHNLPVVTISDLVRYRRAHAELVTRGGQARIPTADADFTAISYQSVLDGIEHVAFTLGAVDDGAPVLVRVHSECLTGDLFGSLRCDCGPQFRAALADIAAAGRGVLVYLRGQEGRGIGLGHKLRAYQLQQDLGLDTVEANIALGLPVDAREYGIGAAILADLGIRDVLLMTNNLQKYYGLDGYGIRVVQRVPIQTQVTPQNVAYLSTKRDRMGHLLDLPRREGTA